MEDPPLGSLLPLITDQQLLLRRESLSPWVAPSLDHRPTATVIVKLCFTPSRIPHDPLKLIISSSTMISHNPLPSDTATTRFSLTPPFLAQG